MTTGSVIGAPSARDGGGLRIVPVVDRRDLDDFIELPLRLYRGCPGFVAPLCFERRESLSRRRNPYFNHAKAQFWLACRGDRTVGRVSAQIDDLHLVRHRDGAGQFGFLDAVDDGAVFEALIATAESWLKSRGMSLVRGPFNLSINQECGLLIDGFEAPAMLMMAFNLPYAAAHLDRLGYRRARDLIAYDYDVAGARQVDANRYIDRLGAAERIKIQPLNMRRYSQDIAAILDIFNDAWSENWGFVPLTEAEVVHAAGSMRLLIRPELVWIAQVDDEPVGMIVALPNLYEAIADLEGRLLPIGWIKLAWRLKVSGVQSARVVLFGIRRRFHGTPLGAALALLLLEQLRQQGKRFGIRRAELSWILEDNAAVRRVIETVGGTPYKTYRIFEKVLA